MKTVQSLMYRIHIEKMNKNQATSQSDNVVVKYPGWYYYEK